MKYFLYLIFPLFLSPTSLKAQGGNSDTPKCQIQKNNQLDQMINQSLVSYLAKINKYVEKGIISNKYYNNLFIDIDAFPPHFEFDNNVKIANLNTITINNISAHKKKLKKGVDIIKFDGMNLTKDTLTIRFSSRFVQLKRNKLSITLSYWGSYIYKYNCNKQVWILTETNYGGI